MSKLSAITLLGQLQLDRFISSSMEEDHLKIDGERIDFDLYKPRKESRGTIVTINGFSPMGSRDRRFLALNKALAGCGFTVVSPMMSEIAALKVDSKHVELIAQLLRKIASNKSLSPDGKVSVLSPSFSAGMCLIAASLKPSDHIKAICAIGSYSRIESLLKILMGKQDTDEYGRMILLRNFVRLSIGKKATPIEQGLDHVLRDNYFHWEKPTFPDFEKRMKAPARELLRRLRMDREFRLMHWDRVVANGGKKAKILKDLCAITRIKEFQTPVALIHGKSDDVVPASQSQELYDALTRMGAPVKLVITPLLSHGDAQANLGMLPAFVDLVNGFAFFFSHASAQ